MSEWRGRIVADIPNEPQEWFMSAVNDPKDWTISSVELDLSKMEQKTFVGHHWSEPVCPDVIVEAKE